MNGLFVILKRGTNWKYCKSLKYSGNNKIAIIALCPYALFQNPFFIKLPNIHIERQNKSLVMGRHMDTACSHKLLPSQSGRDQRVKYSGPWSLVIPANCKNKQWGSPTAIINYHAIQGSSVITLYNVRPPWLSDLQYMWGNILWHSLLAMSVSNSQFVHILR